MSDKYPWKSQRTGYIEALQYLKGRKEGKIRSLRTPWEKVNEAGVDGFEWHSMVVIAGRPGTGKTLIKDQLVREAFKINKGENMRVLEFQFEMLARVSKVREFSAVLGQSYKYVCSAGGDKTLSNDDLAKCHAYSKTRVDNPVDIVEKPCTVDQWKKTIRKYFELHSTKDPVSGKKLYQKTLITVDHSYLFKQAPNERSKTDMLYNLGEAATEIKREFPAIIIILSQLGRDTDRPERNEDGKYGNYILSSDVFGGDALIQNADLVFGVNRPAQRFIKYYGVEKFVIADESVLVFHFLKVRNGDTRMSFMRAEFDKMAVSEMPTPPTQQRKLPSNII